ncbi:Calx-beta domain-containing protein [Zobellia roscoffensis]|uniref:Calx-beta domain-containing protein n=1 Tax=Zobellia roscoffensis TaxID=2779508 RepID=UPI001889E3ED|nr:Calx-beta domain-containing protein [Zobellia roscoffensis]
MVNSTLLLFRKPILAQLYKRAHQNSTFKRFLLFFGGVLMITSGFAQDGQVKFSEVTYSGTEGNNVTLSLERVGGSNGEIAVDIQTFDGTATLGDDYSGIPSPLTITWADGNTNPKTVTLPISMDDFIEGDETFTMTIASTNPAWVGTNSTATVTITDVPPGNIQFEQADYLVDEDAGTITLTIERVGSSNGEIAVDIQTFDGTATLGDDYSGIPSPLTITWADGNTNPKTVTLPISMDDFIEGDETFTMTIASTNPAWVGTNSTATVTITDVPPGNIQFEQADYLVDEDAGTITLTIERVGSSNGEIAVDIQTFDGTATLGDDYSGIPSPLTITWADGNTNPKTVTLPISMDDFIEGDETFTMTIASTNPAWVGTNSTATVTIIDSDSPGKIQYAQAAYTVAEDGGSITLIIQRVGGSKGAIDVDFQMFEGTATAAVDYTSTAGLVPLHWPDGNITPKHITVLILEDDLPEGDETFTQTLTSDNPDWIGIPSTATVTITANDGGSNSCETSVTANAGADQIVCGNKAITLTATASGSGIWSGGLGTFSDATAQNNTYTPDATEIGTTITLTWTTDDPDGDGPCEALADMVDITFDEKPNAGIDNDTSVFEGTVVHLLSLVSQPGGTFSGPGVSGNTFDTTGLANGNYPITYTVNSGNSCPDDTAIITIKVSGDSVSDSCEVLDIDYCTPGDAPFYNFYWDEMRLAVPGSEFFSQNATHSLSFTEFDDGTALIQGSTQSGNCSANLHIVLKDVKDWTNWSNNGGNFKPQGCNPGALVKENLRYYVIDATKSSITTTGGDCLEEGTYKVHQRPDPNDASTPNLGVHVGPGGALYDTDTAAEGIAGWAWMGPLSDKYRWKIDFNFHIKCNEDPVDGSEEVCDGIDNDLDGHIDEGFDSDNDGVADCYDICDGGDDNTDSDADGTPDYCDHCDDTTDTDGDGIPDCNDTEECDGLDNDGDGEIDEGFDSDSDGVADCYDVCDGGDDNADSDADGKPDHCDDCDDTTDTDGDGIPDCNDTEECDGLDNDGDGEIDEGFDSDSDGVADCYDVCDGGDDNADSDADGKPDHCDDCDDTTDTDGDGIPDCNDTEECDGLDNDGDGEIDEGFDSDSDGVADCYDVCDGGDDNADSDADGKPDHCDDCDDTTDTDGDGIPDCNDTEECDGLDNDGDGEIDEGLNCKTPTNKTPNKTVLRTYHKSYEGSIKLDIDIPYDATLNVQFFDLSGKLVMKKSAGSVTSGNNLLQIEIHDLATKVHIMVIDTGKEVIRKKVYFHK